MIGPGADGPTDSAAGRPAPDGWAPEPAFSGGAAAPGPDPESTEPGEPAEPSAEPGIVFFGEPAEPPAPAVCWRCGRAPPPGAAACPLCHASFGTSPRRAAPAVRAPNTPVVRLVAFFGVMLLVSVAFAAVRKNASPGAGEADLVFSVILMEGIDTLLVLGALRVLPRPAAAAAPGGVGRAAVWLGSVGALAAMLLANRAYHRCLLDYIGIQPPPTTLVHTALPLVLVYECLQPALVEELFFRYLCLGTLRDALGGHGAVWVSAVMFGMAHIYVPLSMPYLIVLGAVLGYARLAGGGMALPMVLHFLHNAMVLYWERNP